MQAYASSCEYIKSGSKYRFPNSSNPDNIHGTIPGFSAVIWGTGTNREVRVGWMTFKTPSYFGPMQDLVMTLPMSAASDDFLVYYALCDHGGDLSKVDAYLYDPYAEDDGRIITGEFDVYEYETRIDEETNETVCEPIQFVIPVTSLKPSTIYTLIIWTTLQNTQAGFWKVTSDYGGSIILNHFPGMAYIDNGTTTNQYQCYVDNGTSWDLVVPYVDNGTSWDMYG